MMKRRAVLLSALAWPLAARAAEPKPGLAWNKTGLPLVFPLHIRSVPGHLYFVRLTDAKDNAPALAAHFTGGTLFRVLCPPGRFWIDVHRGLEWQDEDTLFGRATQTVGPIGPLDFKTKGTRTRQGWVLDLRDFARPSLLA